MSASDRDLRGIARAAGKRFRRQRRELLARDADDDELFAIEGPYRRAAMRAGLRPSELTWWRAQPVTDDPGLIIVRYLG